MGSLAKALLRRKDPSLQHACARVDSVDLAKKRLAAKTRAEMGGGLDASGQACVDGEPAEGTVDAEQGNQSNVPPHLEVLTIASDDEGDGVPTPLAARQLNDSIRIAKQRLRQRASIDVVSGPQIQASRSRASWSSSGTPRHLTEDGTQPEGESALQLHSTPLHSIPPPTWLLSHGGGVQPTSCSTRAQYLS